MPPVTPAKLVNVTIRVDSTAQGLDDVVKRLKACGLADAETRARFGIVNGSAPADRLEDLRRIEGVASVREDSVYRAGTR